MKRNKLKKKSAPEKKQKEKSQCRSFFCVCRQKKELEQRKKEKGNKSCNEIYEQRTTEIASFRIATMELIYFGDIHLEFSQTRLVSSMLSANEDADPDCDASVFYTELLTLPLPSDCKITKTDILVFNEGMVTPDNIASFLRVVSFFMIEGDIADFLLKRSVPSNTAFSIPEEFENLMIRLPLCMLGEIYSFDLRWKSAVKFDMTNYIHFFRSVSNDIEMKELATIAAREGSMQCLEYAHLFHFHFDEYTFQEAVQGNHQSCVLFLHKIGCPCKLDVCSVAVRNGHLTILSFLLTHGYSFDRVHICEIACAYGQLDCLKLLWQNHGCPVDRSTFFAGVIHGHPDCLQFLIDVDCPWDSDNSCFSACCGGHLSSLRFVLKHGARLSSNATFAACSAGHLDCLKFLHERGCPWDSGAITVARHRNNMECLEYALANGCPS